jgi:hypothetical protein
MPLTPSEIAVAFSSHRFDEAEPYLADNVFWDLVAAQPRLDKPEVIALTAESAEALTTITTTFIDQRVIDGGDTVVVDSVVEYIADDGEKSVVSSCDLYEFENGLVVHIRSYAGVRSY